MNDRPNAHLKELIRQPVGKEPAAEPESGLPSLMDDYSPFSRLANKPLYSIHFIGPNDEMRSFQYSHLDSDSSYSAGKISLRFMGLKAVAVIIEGRNLQPLYDYIHQHRAAWVKQAARDFAPDGTSIVTKITFVEISGDMLSS